MTRVIKSKGPSTDPLGTPYLSGRCSEKSQVDLFKKFYSLLLAN